MACYVNSFIDCGLGTYKATELNGTFEGFNVDFDRLQGRLIEYSGFYLGGDDAVVYRSGSEKSGIRISDISASMGDGR